MDSNLFALTMNTAELLNLYARVQIPESDNCAYSREEKQLTATQNLLFEAYKYVTDNEKSGCVDGADNGNCLIK